MRTLFPAEGAGLTRAAAAAETEGGAVPSGRRGPGRPARIDRSMIIEAALAIDTAGRPLSMRAVAERLGVARPALYHHVADRDALVAMVALARLEHELDEAWMPSDSTDWRAWLTGFAVSIRSRLLAEPAFPEYVLLEGDAGQRQLAQVERLLGVLVRAGFDAADAERCVTLIAELVHVNARAVFVMREAGQEPHRISVAKALKDSDADLPLMRAARADRFDPEAQFLFDLETALDGLAKRVSQTP